MEKNNLAKSEFILNLNKNEWECSVEIGPKQLNVYDCGVFTLMNIVNLASGNTLEFLEEDMPYLRQRILLDIKLHTVGWFSNPGTTEIEKGYEK